MSELKPAAAAVDEAVANLEAAYDEFVSAAQAVDKAHQAKQKARERTGYSKRVPAIHSHPYLNAPNKLLRSVVGSRVRLAKALSVPVTQTKNLVDLIPGEKS